MQGINESGAYVRKYSIIAVGMRIQHEPSHSPAFEDELRQTFQSVLYVSVVHFVYIDSTIGIIEQGMQRVQNWWEVALVISLKAVLITTCLCDTTFIAIEALVEVCRMENFRQEPPGRHLEVRVVCCRKQNQRLEDLLIKSVGYLLEVE